MAEILGFDAFSPKEIAERVESVGVTKARLPILPTVMLGGVVFSLGLILVVVGGSVMVALVYYLIYRRGLKN